MRAFVLENVRVCNLKCEDCPTVYADGYPGGVMSYELFKRVLDNLSPQIFPNCALTGWGEPLLDRGYFEKLELLKKRGYLVGSTTNCTFIEEEVESGGRDDDVDVKI